MPVAPESFDHLLSEKLLQLELHDVEQERLRTDPVELLRLAALRALANGTGRGLPWHGAGGYTEIRSDRMTAEDHKLDVIF
jgi:hypothetical protein